MIVVISGTGTRLDEADDLTGLKIVVLNGVPPELARDQIRNLGPEISERESWVSVALLRELAAGHTSPGWGARFDDMLTFARTRGWVDDGGRNVRVHIETGSPASSNFS